MTGILIWVFIGVCVFRAWAKVNPSLREVVIESNETQRVRRAEGFYGAWLKRILNREIVILVFAVIWPLVVLFLLSDLGKQQKT